MNEPAAQRFDRLFRQAVAAIDRGDLDELRRLLAANPELASGRLEAPGQWLRDEIGAALDGFFARPYLLWFVSEDVRRHGRLPPNITDIARAIIDAAKEQHAATLQDQLDSTLALVSWSAVAADAGLQIPLLDVLVDAGARPANQVDNALVNRHLAAAAHLVSRGGELTLASALCLDRWGEVPALAAAATAEQRQFALVLAALNGKARAVKWLVDFGVPVDEPSAHLYSHGRPLHHAICSGSLETVTTLVEAGADLDRPDTAWNGTPLGWAAHYVEDGKPERRADYLAIYQYLQAVSRER
jgi:peptide-methionine (S)-S-oxide reductase